jgi:hypothetical protein
MKVSYEEGLANYFEGRKGVRNRFGKNSFSVPDTFSCHLFFSEGTIGFLLAQWLLGTVIACTTCRKPEPKN